MMLYPNMRLNVRAITFSVGLLGAMTVRHASTAYLLRTPSPSARREVPTPLIFLSSSFWDSRSQKGLRSLATMFTARGFTCLEIDLAPPEKAETSEALMQHFEAELSSHVRLTMIPFPPIIVARGSATLIAQTYISSHPASGLLLISPPVSNAQVRSSSEVEDEKLLPTDLPEFNFEPKFPCAILCTQQEINALSHNRLWKDNSVSKLIALDRQSLDGHEGFVKIEQWLDEVGV